MKTTGMTHQLAAGARLVGKREFALLMEQGTGKTWVVMADAERLYEKGSIDALFVIAPKGVHTNWVRREIPTHMSIPVIARHYSSGFGKGATRYMEEALQKADALRVLTMNIDALSTKHGFDLAMEFLRSARPLIALDESQRIKNPDALRTRRVMSLRPHAAGVRIMSGTPITNAPADIFSQFEFMKSGLLGTRSYRAFVAEYAELVDMKDVTSENYFAFQQMIKKNPKIAHSQIIAKNPDGSLKWRNLDKLQRLIDPHSFRVLKRDCLDLPEKIYENHYFDLSPAQLKAYELMEKELRIQEATGELTPVKALAAIVKLQQITSGFIIKPNGGGIVYVPGENPRLEALVDLAEDYQGKFIVWARFQEELDHVAAALRKAGRTVVEYHGRVSEKDREVAVDSFQNGAADVFVGQAQSGGVGLTLTAASWVVYYSNDFNRETRAQSEDRAHRIGTRSNVVYTDLVATGTIDEAIARALQRKASLAAEILGDRKIDLRRFL